MKKRYFLILFILVLLLAACGKKEEILNENEILEKFTFDNLEIAIGSNITFTTYDNDFDKDSGKDIVKVPINVKNTKDEKNHLSMFYFKIRNSKNVILPSKATYFKDSIDYAEDLNKDESYTKYIYFLYDGNGKYTIEFNNGSEKKEIYLNITK